jgi:hypothetical protein
VATVPAGVSSWVSYLRSHKDRIKDETLLHFVADACGFPGWERLRRVAEDCQVQVVLHGHHHAADLDPWAWRRGAKGQTLVLSAGSWGLVPDKLPEGQPAMAHLLRLDPVREEACSLLLVYEPRARAGGEVEPGQFVIDPASPQGATLHLSVPEGFRRERAEPVPDAARGAAAVRDFVAAYRATLARTYERWDLGGVGAVQPGGAGRPVEAAEWSRGSHGSSPGAVDLDAVRPGRCSCRARPMWVSRRSSWWPLGSSPGLAARSRMRRSSRASRASRRWSTWTTRR